ncbi:MAG TPA: SH3 domain-containing protein [Methylophilaceae bacterium]|nr:SH3 domain-containing protein [Methylophilaceae bacterium]
MLLLTLLPAIALAETGVALKDDQIRKEPYSDARVAGNITRNQKVEILSRKGAWLNIKTAKTSGWVRLLSVKRGTASSGAKASDVLDLASGRSGTGQVVATTGVRGLNEEDLKSAKFDESQIKALERYTQTQAQGLKFAQAGGLKPAKLKYLPAPASAAPSTRSGPALPGGAK